MNITRIIYRFLLIFALSIMAESVFGASIKLSVSPPRGKREIAVGDIFYISYQLTDTDEIPSAPANVDGAKVMYFDRTSQSSSFQSINGKTTQSYSFIYTLTLKAEKEGNFSFGPISVGSLKSNAVNYSIVKTSSVPSPGSQSNQKAQPQGNSQQSGPRFIGKGDGNLFLRAHVSTSDAYEGQALVYIVKLYTTYDQIKFIGATATPKFDGFVVEESDDISSSLTYETVDGKTYATAVIARYIIFPQMAGKLKVTGNTYTVSVDEREYFHDPFFGNLSRSKPLQLNVTPNDLAINVKSLPMPQPSNFCGGVGRFTLSSSLPSDNLASNQAGSIVYTVTGTGNLKYIVMPDLNTIYPPEIEVYSPSTDVKAKVGSSNVTGDVKFDYSFMPLESGHFQIPEVTISYFNPDTGGYETTTASGYSLNITAGKGSVKSQTKSKLSFNPQLMKVTELRQLHKPMIRTFLYWLFFIIPVVLFIVIVIAYKAHVNAKSDVLATRSRKAGKMARNQLRKADLYLKDGNANSFYDAMLSALWGYLGDKLNISPSELNRENVSGKLQEREVDSDTVNNVLTLLDDCEFAKYSPIADENENMLQIYNRGLKLIEDLDSKIKTLKKNKHE